MPARRAGRRQAYGLAGLVKGRGITALKDCEVMATLQKAIEDKKDARKRQAALFAYGAAARAAGERLGRLTVSRRRSPRGVHARARRRNAVAVPRPAVRAVRGPDPAFPPGRVRRWRTRGARGRARSLQGHHEQAQVRHRTRAERSKSCAPRLCDGGSPRWRDRVGAARASGGASAHCVKLILPSLLTGLEDKQWRSKQVSFVGARRHPRA